MPELAGDTREVARIGVVGCGRIAQYHLKFLSEMRGARVMGLADVDIANAVRLGERYGVTNVHGSLESLLDSTAIDVLHVLTPPAHHYAQASVAIERGLNVLIEKPMGFRASEVVDLYDRAAAKGVLVCPDFIHLFHSRVRGAMDAVNSGRLGRVVHCESHLSIDPDITELRELPHLHWSYELPGGIFHDSITHLLYLVLYWIGSPRRVTVSPRSFGTMPQGLTDHLEIFLEGDQISGRVTLSAVTKPRHYYLRLFCEKGSVLVNFHTLTIVIDRESRLPTAIDRALSNLRQAYHLSKATLVTSLEHVRGQLPAGEGLRNLLVEYYGAIRGRSSPPVSRALSVAVAQTEEAVLAQAGKLRLDLRSRPSTQQGITRRQRVLVTGAAGYLGAEIVRQLVRGGYYVRALVRPLNRIEDLERLGVELTYGDVREWEEVRKAGEGMDIVVHCAAGLRGSRDFVVESCVTGTRNVMQLAGKCKLKRLIYISSVGVYDFQSLRKGSIITEQTPLEGQPENRGLAAMAKREAENVALSHLARQACQVIILRPSFIFGNGRDVLSALGIKVGNTLVSLASPAKHLQLVHVEDVGAAVIKAIEHQNATAGVFNLSHPERVTVRKYVTECLRKSRFKNLRVLYVPHWAACAGVIGFGIMYRAMGKRPAIALRQLATAYRDVLVDSGAIRKEMGWEPRPDLVAQLRREVDVGHTRGSECEAPT